MEAVLRIVLVPCLLLIWMITTTISLRTDETKSMYCQTELFTARCELNQVVLLDRAHYGRMRVGPCVATDYGNVGCYSNVIKYADRLCSGRHQCQIRVPDSEFDNTKPCPAEFKTYLEIEFSCLTVSVPERRKCQPYPEATLTTYPGFLANIVTEETGHGSITCPWKVNLPRGQRINVTLIDFTTPKDYPNGGSKKGFTMCHQYAIITERTSVTRNTRVCGGSSRVVHAYESSTNNVEIRFIRKNVELYTNYHFVLKYDAIGCRELKAPENGWVEEDISGATMGCNLTDRKWRLRCHGNKWVGEFPNCTGAHPRTDGLKWGGVFIPYGVSVGIIAGLAVIIGVIILLVGLICLEWRKVHRSSVPTSEPAVEQTPSLPPGSGTLTKNRNSHHHSTNRYSNTSSYTDHGSGTLSKPPSAVVTESFRNVNDNDYAYMKELWPLAPPPGQIMLDTDSDNEKRCSSLYEYTEPDRFSPCHDLLPDGRHHIYESPQTLRREVEALRAAEAAFTDDEDFELDRHSHNSPSDKSPVDRDLEAMQPCLRT